MPSQAYQQFKENSKDTLNLIDSHKILSTGNKGKQGLGHITRSGILMLCASFELYIESLLLESVNFFKQYLTSPMNLPKLVQKNIALQVRNDKHELKPLHLAGIGWQTVFYDYAKAATDSLNTPNSTNLYKLFKNYLGLENFSSNWNIPSTDLDSFISKRGAIAHTGREAKYIRIPELIKDNEIILKLVREIDELLLDHLKNNNPTHRQPWNRTY